MSDTLGPPVVRDGDAYVMEIGLEERRLVNRLLKELEELLTVSTTDDAEAKHLLNRLFPVVYPDDPELEEEYQRLMRADLVRSKVASIGIVSKVLGDPSSGPTATLTENELMAFMQATNSVRLVLGTLLGITDDDDDDDEFDERTGQVTQSPERALYVYLSWMLDASVHALGT